MKEKAKVLVMKILLRIVYRLCRFNRQDIMLAREISVWQDIHDTEAPTVFPRPLYP